MTRELDCLDSGHGLIGDWDVSRVTDLSDIFMGAKSFLGGISKWDVSRVTDMSHMFAYATQFNGNISKYFGQSSTCRNERCSWC